MNIKVKSQIIPNCIYYTKINNPYLAVNIDKFACKKIKMTSSWVRYNPLVFMDLFYRKDRQFLGLEFKKKPQIQCIVHALNFSHIKDQNQKYIEVSIKELLNTINVILSDKS